jgi:hypothetical protein
MTNESMTQNREVSKLKLDAQLFDFMGVLHPVWDYQGERVIYIKHLVDQIGLDWRNQRTKVLDGDNATLYGTMKFELLPNSGGASIPENSDTPPETVAGGAGFIQKLQFVTPKEGVYLVLKRVEIYLARLSTNQIRARGNEDAANILLALQQEWADALHQYESLGVAIKKNFVDDLKLFNMLVKGKASTGSPLERAIYKKALLDLAESLDVEVQKDWLDEVAGV